MTMHHFRKTRRIIAVFFVINFLSQICFPTISYALTAGPTAPEFSSFEPVDTTDMVNLATGEFVYNNPILEVPGPEGGYPLSLSYHAGIKLDQEASWVGLGFTLNPGAINRTVNGFADDNHQTKREVRDYWDGGNQVTKTYSLGLAVPNTGLGINYSLARTTDTFKGFSTKSTFGVSIDPVKVGFNMVQANYGSRSWAGSNGAYYESAYRNVSQLTGNTSLGISMDSEGNSSSSISVFGQHFNQTNGYSGSIKSITNTYDRGAIPIGTFGSLSLKDFHTRYWSDENQALHTFGALYPGMANNKIEKDYYTDEVQKEFITYSFDTFDYYDGTASLPNSANKIVDDPSDPTKQLGGSLPAYDRFDVMAQGLGGTIQPYIFENGDLYGQNIYNRNPETGGPQIYNPILSYKTLKKFSNKKVDFRFLNDFSNALTIDPASIELDGNGMATTSSQSTQALADGFNSDGENQKLAGSKHIEWYTNEEIVNGDAQNEGFVDHYANKADRPLDFEVFENYLQPEACLPYVNTITTDFGKGSGSFKGFQYTNVDDGGYYRSLKPKLVDLRKKIGGFKITNETGVTYHYALPVYNYNEYTRSQLKDPRKGASTFREYTNNDPYAYTWLLTAITGPDYVDRNKNGTLDDDDWGYWVKFDYGRWADAYQWRTPHTGYMDDLESEYATFSYGIKELYYLDAIETRSHKAIFIKSKRKDGRGVTSRLEGGSKPRNYKMPYRFSNKTGKLDFVVSPVSTMKLDAIYLFNKEDITALGLNKAKGTKYNDAPNDYYYTGQNYLHRHPYKANVSVTIEHNVDKIRVKYHNGDLVYDDDDIAGIPEIKQKALRIIEFNTDYSLAEGVPNSIGYFSDVKASSTGIVCSSLQPFECDEIDQKIGDEYEWPSSFGGPNCTSLPFGRPYCCGSNEDFYSYQGIFQHYSDMTSACPDGYLYQRYSGNAIEYFHTGKLTLKGIKFLGKGGVDLIPSTMFSYNYNPDYRLNSYDEWGYFKSDYNTTWANATRRISQVSSTNTDAWSLTSITSPLGANIDVEYEPNEYRESVYNDFSTFTIEKIDRLQNNQVKVTFKEKQLNLSTWFSVNSSININAFVVGTVVVPSIERFPPYYIYKGHNDDVVVSISQNELIVLSARLYSYLSPTEWTPTSIATIPYFIAGFVTRNESGVKFAGGIRVRSLSVSSTNQTSVSLFDYKNPSTLQPSGVTSFKPYNLPSIQFPKNVEFFDDIFQDNEKKEEVRYLQYIQGKYQKEINDVYRNLLIFSREIPAPGVIYEYVTVKNKRNDVFLENSTTHQFKVFKQEMITREIQNNPLGVIDTREVVVKNSASGVGSLLRSIIYNAQQEPVKTTTYNHLFDDSEEAFESEIASTKQGVVEQAFHKHIELKDYEDKYDEDDGWEQFWEDIFVDRDRPTTVVIYTKEKALVTKRQERTNVVTSVQEIDHKRGITSTTKNLAFDFYSGQPIKVLSTDSYGNKVLSVTEPAYRNYPDMGLMIYNSKRKNMLTQVSANHQYKVNDALEPVGLLSSSVQTWSNNFYDSDSPFLRVGVWRKQATYSWNGSAALNTIDGTYPYADFDNNRFDWDDEAVNTHWEKTGEVTLYDAYSHALEAKDINNNFSSVLMSNDFKRVIASATNASYNEIAYSGAEYYGANLSKEGGVMRGAGNPSKAHAHTGHASLLVGSGKQGFSYELTTQSTDLNKSYKASVWVYAPGISETQTELNKIKLYALTNGVKKEVHPIIQKSKSKSWYLLQLDIEPKGYKTTIGCENYSLRGVYFDDFRVHPLDASLTTYVYDQHTGELTYILDANNFYTKFEYDPMGRLVRTSKEQLNFDYGTGKESYKEDAVLKEVKYNYGKN